MRAIIDGVEKTSRSPLPICAAVLTPCAQVVIASPLIPCLFRVRTSHCARGPAEAAMPSHSRYEMALHGQCVQKWIKDGTAYLFDKGTSLRACSEAALRCPAQDCPHTLHLFAPFSFARGSEKNTQA